MKPWIPSQNHKELDVMIHAYDLSNEEVEAGVLVFNIILGYTESSKPTWAIWHPDSKKQKNKSKLPSPTFFWHEKKLYEPMKQGRIWS